MNARTLLAAVVMSALTSLHSPAQDSKTDNSLPISVNVLGDVNKPSRISLPVGSTALDAIASAGGFGKDANPAKTVLIHRTKGDKPDSETIDLKAVLVGRSKDVTLKDNDTMVIATGIY